MKKIKIHISFLLLAAFALFSAPKEMLHGLTEHHDSMDMVCHDECSHHIEEEHQHCDVLQLSSPPLYHSFNTISFSSDDLFCVLQTVRASSYHFSSSPFLFLRGPPATS